MYQYIPYVTSGLTLVSFIMATIAYMWRSKLRSAEKSIESAPPEQRARVIATIAEWIEIDLKDIPEAQRARIVMMQLQLKEKKQKYVIMGILGISLLLCSLSAYAIFVSRYSSQPIITPNVSLLTPFTPRATLASMMGPPLADSEINSFFEGEEDKKYSAAYYQFRKEIYLVDVFEADRHLGFSIYPKDRETRVPPFSRSLDDVEFGDIQASCGPPSALGGKLNISSSPCPAASASRDIVAQYNFYAGDLPEMDCTFNPEEGYKLEECPALRALNPVSVSVSFSEEDVEKVSAIAQQEYDHPRFFHW